MSHGEACGHALHNGSASLAPFQPVAKANQTEMAVLQTAQVNGCRTLWTKQEKEQREKEEGKKMSSSLDRNSHGDPVTCHLQHW